MDNVYRQSVSVCRNMCFYPETVYIYCHAMRGGSVEWGKRKLRKSALPETLQAALNRETFAPLVYYRS